MADVSQEWPILLFNLIANVNILQLSRTTRPSKGVAECGSRTLAGRGGGPPKGRKKNSDLIYFCRKLGCGTQNASAVAVNVLRLSRYPFIWAFIKMFVVFFRFAFQLSQPTVLRNATRTLSPKKWQKKSNEKTDMKRRNHLRIWPSATRDRHAQNVVHVPVLTTQVDNVCSNTWAPIFCTTPHYPEAWKSAVYACDWHRCARYTWRKAVAHPRGTASRSVHMSWNVKLVVVRQAGYVWFVSILGQRWHKLRIYH